MERNRILFGLLIAACAASANADYTSTEVQWSRYSIASLAPKEEEANPLAVIVSVTFPRGNVHTVGDAIRHLLVRTGYSLEDGQLDPLGARLLSLPLPESHRALGPYRVDSMLGVLLGKSWELQVDDVRRSVSFVSAKRIEGGR